MRSEARWRCRRSGRGWPRRPLVRRIAFEFVGEGGVRVGMSCDVVVFGVFEEGWLRLRLSLRGGEE